MFTSFLLSCGTAILVGSSKNRCFAAVGTKKMYVGHPVSWMVLRFAIAPALLFSSFQLADGCGSDVANICIPMNVQPLPSLDMCHDDWTLAKKTTWQHVFTGFPATIYCSSVGKHFRAASLATTHRFCKLAFGVVHPLMLNVQLLCKSRVGRNSVSKEDGVLAVSFQKNVPGQVISGGGLPPKF